MKILLVNPPSLPDRVRTAPTMSGSVAPLGLGYIAAYLEMNGHSVEIFDFNAKIEIDCVKTIMAFVRTFNPEIIGISTLTETVQNARRIAQNIKKEFPQKILVAGGIHASFVPEHLLFDGTFNSVVIGDGEVTFSQLVSCYEHQESFTSIPGVATLNPSSGMLHFTPRRPIKNLDCLPYPKRNYNIIKPYRELTIAKWEIGGRKLGEVKKTGVITSRGCTGTCSFCSSFRFSNGYRVRSVQNVTNEIIFLISQGIEYIKFLDDAFGAYKKFAFEFVNSVKSLAFLWECMMRVEDCDPELIPLMASAGCVSISFGIETGSQRIASEMRKFIDRERLIETFRTCENYGIDPKPMMMFGWPGENDTDVQESIELLLILAPRRLRFSFAQILPGTTLERRFIKKKPSLSGWEYWLKNENSPIYFSQQSYRNYIHKLIMDEVISVLDCSYAFS